MPTATNGFWLGLYLTAGKLLVVNGSDGSFPVLSTVQV